MKRVTETNRMEMCANLDTFDFEPWKEKSRGMAKVEVKDAESKVRSIDN